MHRPTRILGGQRVAARLALPGEERQRGRARRVLLALGALLAATLVGVVLSLAVVHLVHTVGPLP